MKPKRNPLALLFVLALLLSCQSNSNLKLHHAATWNDHWVFSIEGHADTLVHIPHTARLEPLVVNDQWQGKMTYKKNLTLKALPTGLLYLHFEGVMHTAEVFINGVFAGRHEGGYLPFSIAVSPFIHIGDNEIKLLVENTDNAEVPPGKPLHDLDFNFYGGIYRDVWLIEKNQIQFSDPFLLTNENARGVHLHFDTVDASMAKGHIYAHVNNLQSSGMQVQLIARLKEKEKEIVFSTDFFYLKAATDTILTMEVLVNNPLLWSHLNPNLYKLSIEIVDTEKQVHDSWDKMIGIRKIELKKDGFFLNGQQVFLRGTNRHQEYPYVGYAISNNANYRDAVQIKNAGFDFVRLSHYPQDEAFLDACDELGLLVMNAIPGWQHFQEGHFATNALNDIRKMAFRDRHHPSVVFWENSLNESAMTEQFMEQANEVLREVLPFENTFSAGWLDHPSYDLFIPARQHGKPPHYWNHYKKGERAILIAEYGDWEYYAQNAGFNQKAFLDLKAEDRSSRQLRESGEKRMLQQAYNFQEAANSNRRGRNTIGHANWVMYDYNRGYADDLESSGIADIFRIPKFAYFFYQSQRPPQENHLFAASETGPMVRIASFWNEESRLPITVFSNCDEVEMYLNEKFLGRQKADSNEASESLQHPPFIFNVPTFESGTLKAIGFINGQEAARLEVHTPEKPERIELAVNFQGIDAFEPNDIIIVYAKLLDRNGTIVPTNNVNVQFLAKSDNIELIGENPAEVKAGIASILLKRKLPGIFKIEAFSDGLMPSNESFGD